MSEVLLDESSKGREINAPTYIIDVWSRYQNLILKWIKDMDKQASKKSMMQLIFAMKTMYYAEILLW